MKYITGQKHHNYTGQTTFALDSLDEANGLIHEALNDSSKLSKSIKEYREITHLNPHYRAKNQYNNTIENQLKAALREIEVGKPELEAEISVLASHYEEYAKEVEPSLTLEQSFAPAEEGEQFDAGKIASEDPLAFFSRKDNDRPRSGRGDGAYRILINTDVAWFGDPSAQCAALIAIVNLMQREAPVEIWVQQGWLGTGAKNGVTLFKVFGGGQILTKHLYFWVGSQYKDSPYSYTISRMLGRERSGVSVEPEMPCDLYIYPTLMPSLNKETFKDWVTHTARQMLFDEELPEHWYGATEGRPTDE